MVKGRQIPMLYSADSYGLLNKVSHLKVHCIGINNKNLYNNIIQQPLPQRVAEGLLQLLGEFSPSINLMVRAIRLCQSYTIQLEILARQNFAWPSYL